MRSILLRLSATTRLALAGFTPFLAGCGGGGGSASGGAPTPGRTSSLVTFNVDVATGKVKIANTQDTRSRAVLTGGAVTFGSSDLLSVGGDSGKRLLRVSVTNNT